MAKKAHAKKSRKGMALRKPTEEGPTGFFVWWSQHPEWTDELLAKATRDLDPEHGICRETVMRIRKGHRSDAKGIYLLMLVTGLSLGDFLPREFLRRLGRRR